MIILIAIFLALTIKSLVALAVGIHERFKEAIDRWNALPGKDRHLRMKFRLMRPIRLPIGFGQYRFFYLDKPFKSIFFSRIVSLTIDLLLLIPDSVIARWNS
jgi:hypothetical protein